MAIASILWRRVDVPGHDACLLEQARDGWRLDGAAVFRQEESPAQLRYRIEVNDAWQAREGSVRGWIGAQVVDLVIRRSVDGLWSINGELVTGLGRCVDLDLGFTPATNLFHLRRIALAEGQAAAVPAAWLDANAGTLDVLHQRYERLNADTYMYEAPRFDYAARLEVSSVGFVQRYPGLWEAEL